MSTYFNAQIDCKNGKYTLQFEKVKNIYYNIYRK